MFSNVRKMYTQKWQRKEAMDKFESLESSKEGDKLNNVLKCSFGFVHFNY